ncbi:MAG: nitrate/nitrite transporter NrtS [Gemmatimonadota bacterium]
MTGRTLLVELCRRSVLLRALKFALVVGPLLIAINHGDVMVQGGLPPVVYLKMALTFLVPFFVSALSSAGAALASGPRRGLPAPPQDP